MRTRLPLLSLLATLSVAAAAPAAHADDVCAGAVAGCPGTNYHVPAQYWESQLFEQYPSVLTDGDADTVWLAGETFTATGGLTVKGGSQYLTIIGAGRDQTKITSNGSQSTYVVDSGFGANSRPMILKNLTIEVPETWADGPATAALHLEHGALENVDIISKNPRTAGIVGKDVALKNVRIVTPDGDAVRALGAPAALDVQDSTLEGASGVRSETAGGTVNVQRSSIHATSEKSSAYGVGVAHGTAHVDNTVIKVNSGTSFYAVAGVRAYLGSLTADHVTVLRDGGKTSGVMGFNVSSDDAGAPATGTITNSIVVGATDPLFRWAAQGGTADMTVHHTLFDKAYSAGTGAGAIVDGGGLLTGAPTFEGEDGARLAAGSLGIDAGDPATAAGATDRAGAARVQDGDGNGTAVTDMGAYERSAPAPVASAPQDGGGTPAGGTTGGPATGGTGTSGTTGTTGTTGTPILNAQGKSCRVPKLKGATLRTAKKRLAKAGCKVGKVQGRRGASARVRTQTVKAGKVVKAGTRVGVRLAIKR